MRVSHLSGSTKNILSQTTVTKAIFLSSLNYSWEPFSIDSESLAKVTNDKPNLKLNNYFGLKLPTKDDCQLQANYLVTLK